MLLAQLQSVPPEFLKSLLLVLLGLVGGAAALATVYGSLRTKRVEPQPLEVKGAAEFVTRDFCGQMHQETVRRVDEHARQIERIWKHVGVMQSDNREALDHMSTQIYERLDGVRSEMTAETQTTRAIMGKGFQDVERAIGRLEGKINGRLP